jgi:hypothetical protein
MYSGNAETQAGQFTHASMNARTAAPRQPCKSIGYDEPQYIQFVRYFIIFLEKLEPRWLGYASVNSKAALLTRVVRFNEEGDKALLNMDLVVTDSDGRVTHNQHAAWVSFADSSWESESEKVHETLSRLLEDRLNSPLLFGLFGAEIYHL